MEEFLRNNWFWILLIGLFFWMHRRGGGGCGTHGRGGHGAHGGHGSKKDTDP